MPRSPVALASSLAAALLLAACTVTTAGTPSARPPATAAPETPSSSPSATHSSVPPHRSRPTAPSAPATSGSPAAARTAAQVLAGMSEAQRVGQLLMVDCPSTGVSSAALTAITQDDVGSVILDDTTSQGLDATRAVTGRLRSAAPSGVGLLISTDQEGGEVQRLRGSGFSAIPSGLSQGAMSTATLRSDATTWGAQLKAAGVNVDLGPVLDTVPDGFGDNPPIGDLDREFGHDPSTVASHGVAVIQGLLAAGVDPTVKHFPGLGRVHGNTDKSSGVTDEVTTSDDAYLAPFRAAVDAGTPFVMTSTAIYNRIDPGVPAAFSSQIVTGMLRDQLGFGGVVVSDDLGNAAQVSGYSYGQRAVDFVAAGGDVVLTVNPAATPAMVAALLAKAHSDAAFREQVDAAALTVLSAKQSLGLLR